MYTPSPIHEWRNPSPWTTCTIDSGTMGAAKASAGRISSTGAEADRLWTAIGRGLDGYTSDQLRAGQSKLYTHVPRHYESVGEDVTHEHLTSIHVSQGIVLYGQYELLPAAIRNASKQPGYDGGHAIYVENIKDSSDVLVLDPLGRADLVRVPALSLLGYSASHGYEHDVYREGEWTTPRLARATAAAICRKFGLDPAKVFGYGTKLPSMNWWVNRPEAAYVWDSATTFQAWLRRAYGV